MECIFLKKEAAAFIEEVANAMNLRNKWKWQSKKQNTNEHENSRWNQLQCLWIKA